MLGFGAVRDPAYHRNVVWTHLRHVLRAWLYPTRRLQELSGWLSTLYVVGAFLVVPFVSVGGASLHSPRAGLWTLAAMLAVLLVLALAALWNAIVEPRLTADFVFNGHNHSFDVVIRRTGPPLTDAALRLIVPASFGSSRLTRIAGAMRRERVGGTNYPRRGN